MSVDVAPVRTRADKREFIGLPYRLHANGTPWVPPLRLERRLHLNPRFNPFFKHGEAQLFLARERERRTTTASGFEEQAADLLAGYLWPGNVRELRSVVERAALLTPGASVAASALPGHLIEQPATLWAGRDRRPSLKDVEQAYIRHILDQTGGSQTRAAALLGISRKALWEKRRRYGIP